MGVKYEILWFKTEEEAMRNWRMRDDPGYAWWHPKRLVEGVSADGEPRFGIEFEVYYG